MQIPLSSIQQNWMSATALQREESLLLIFPLAWMESQPTSPPTQSTAESAGKEPQCNFCGMTHGKVLTVFMVETGNNLTVEIA